jgi:glycosyltransferase involved in cell wall biosynthesis
MSHPAPKDAFSDHFADIPQLLDEPLASPVDGKESPACTATTLPPHIFTDASSEDTIARVTQTLSRLEELAELLTLEDDYVPATLDYPLPRNFRLSIVIPVYNEEQTIARLLARVAALPLAKEVIVVDDCSTDDTRRVLQALDRARGVHVIFKPHNEGKGAALRTGFRRASGDVVVVQDADLEYDPRDIVPLIRPIVEGRADVAYGSRFLGEKPQDPSVIHRVGNGLLTWVSNMTTGLALTDMETCYKAFRRDALRGIEIHQNRFGFEPEVTAKLARRKCRFTEVPITYAARSYAEGKKIGVKDLFSALWCIARYGACD